MNDRFEAAIEAIYEAAIDPSRLPYALQAVADVFGDVGASVAWSRDSGGIGTIVSPSQAKEHHLYEQGGWNARDLRAIRAVERGYFFSGTPFTDRHICSAEEIQTAPIYAEFLAPLGIRWIGAVAVSPDPHLGVLLCVHRSQSRPPFSDSELSMIARLGRHLERSLRLGIHLFDSELLKQGLGHAIARLGVGVFALDALGRVVFSNPAGQQLLGDGLSITGGRLVAGGSAARAKLARVVEQVTSSASVELAGNVRPILIDREEGKRSLAVYVLPLISNPNPMVEFLSQARSIVVAISPESDTLSDPTIVRDLLGLTMGEARVAALVGNGLAPREAADKLGITEHTARSTLKQIFSKTGVSRQSELVLLLSKLALR